MAFTIDPKTEPNFLFTLAVLTTCGDITPDYHKVCEKVGIAHARTVY